VLGRLEFNAAAFKAALQRLPSDAMQRAACILFHVGAPGRLPALEDRRRTADRAFTGRAYAREPDTIQRHLERELLDPLIVEALRGFTRLPAASQPVGAGGPRDHFEALEDELDRAITSLERRDLDGTAVALDAWITRRDHSQPSQYADTRAAPSEGKLDRMNRRAVLRNLSVVGTLAVLGRPTDRLDLPDMPEWTTAQHRAPFDGSALNDLASLNARLWQIFAASDCKRDVFALVRHQLDTLAEGLQSSRREAVHVRLCALLSEVLQLAGEVFFDLERYAEAAHCYTVAASLGKEAKARDLWSCAVTRHAFIGVYEGRFADAIPMLELSAHVALDGDSRLSTRRWVDAVAAQAFAGMQDAAACENAIESAAAVQSMTGQIHNGGWLRFDGSRLYEERGSCYVQLGRADDAESALLSALDLNLSARRRGNVLTDLAMVGVQRRDAEQVTSFGRDALGIAQQTRSGVVGRKLHILQRKLNFMLSEPGIRQLNDDITALRSLTATA
jgi:tetratricopeptide (TPR) repeat protein